MPSSYQLLSIPKVKLVHTVRYLFCFRAIGKNNYLMDRRYSLQDVASFSFLVQGSISNVQVGGGKNIICYRV